MHGNTSYSNTSVVGPIRSEVFMATFTECTEALIFLVAAPDVYDYDRLLHEKQRGVAPTTLALNPSIVNFFPD